jgi:DNA-binding transcriptional LysR family regulator
MDLVDDTMTDIVANRIDAGIRFGDLVEKDMIAIRIGPDIRMAVVGARIVFRRPSSSGGLYAWDFEEKGRAFAVRVEGQLVFNNSELIREAALAGQGLAYVYENDVVSDLEAGRLTRISQKWCPAFPGYYLYHPSRRQTPPALAALIEALRYKP